MVGVPKKGRIETGSTRRPQVEKISSGGFFGKLSVDDGCLGSACCRSAVHRTLQKKFRNQKKEVEKESGRADVPCEMNGWWLNECRGWRLLPACCVLRIPCSAAKR